MDFSRIRRIRVSQGLDPVPEACFMERIMERNAAEADRMIVLYKQRNDLGRDFLPSASVAWMERSSEWQQIVEKLLIAAVADADVSVRQSVFLSLHGNGGFDEFLAQADSLSAIFVALNDEDFDVREFAISVAGRLSEKNPAYVLPALRRHLIQLLMHLEQNADNKCREESDKLLGCLIRNLMLH
ncbi:serine/threonine-protein kinase TOR-like isoform X3 [Magnolia sinica]|uniref:serine/threonine-protein kinase TOR-like isoform X3 n=1 Tax=Magnolia sinica TaxID=86752 RepID=UPI00265B1AB1|nr:serine/threonine-protein kinase TOR-like isoform X3 [Magnolia sinica]